MKLGRAKPENMAFTPQLKDILISSELLAFCDHVSAHEPWHRPHSGPGVPSRS